MSPEVPRAWPGVPVPYRGPVRCSQCLFAAHFLDLHSVYLVSIQHLAFLLLLGPIWSIRTYVYTSQSKPRSIWSGAASFLWSFMYDTPLLLQFCFLDSSNLPQWSCHVQYIYSSRRAVASALKYVSTLSMIRKSHLRPLYPNWANPGTYKSQSAGHRDGTRQCRLNF